MSNDKQFKKKEHNSSHTYFFLSKTTSGISQEKMKFNAVVASGISEATWGNIDGTKRLCLTNCSSETHKK